MTKDNQIVHEIVLIINNNQYKDGKDSNKKTVCAIIDLLDDMIKEN